MSGPPAGAAVEAPRNLTGSSGGPTGAPAPDAWRPPPVARRPSTPRWIVAALVVVVIAILLLALLLAGILPGLRGTGGSGGATGFESARDQGQQAADGYDGGNWSLVSATAIIPSGTISAPLNSSSLAGALSSSGCSYTALASGTESVPGVANVSEGNAVAWFFLFRNASNDLLFVSETPEAVTLVGEVTGGCTTYVAFLNPTATTVTDPTVAAAAADEGGGYAFLEAHPNANATLELIGGATLFGASSPAFWIIGYSTCSLIASSQGVTAPAFTANVSAASGDLLQARAYTQACPVTGPGGGNGGSISLGPALSLGPLSEALKSGRELYTTPIAAATPPLAADDLVIQVQTSTGQTVPLAAGSVLNLTSSSGAVLASFAMGNATWVTGGDTGLSAGQEFVLSTTDGLGGQGYVLYFAGSPPYFGNLVVGIP
jgi:hypothetical protein